ncbi:MAG: TlpA family protein disulfide reductase [Clostridia bacterium]|nr:TlpA family protein disulfide reductase [Clostridia bacterium]
MSKLRKLFLVFLITCVAVCISVAVAACTSKNSSKYPGYKNPASASNEYNSNAYQISVQSKGGLPLDGVRVTAKKGDVAVMSGIAINGLVQFALDLDEYVLEISDLPAGYYLDGTVYKTSAKTRNVTVAIPSKVIEETAPANKSYALGEIMYNFGFTDVWSSGTQYYTLSELLQTKQAVVLNFWYRDCGPCRSEFPAIEQAYRAYSDDIALVALTYRDSTSTIADFRENYYFNDYNGMVLSFHMAQDLAGLYNMFGITAFPTTVIIDRYGLIAYKDDGSMPLAAQWRSLFETFIGDDYVQVAPNDDPSGGENGERELPNVDMPASVDVAIAINGNGANSKVVGYYPESNDEYSWPWLLKNDEVAGFKYLSAANMGKLDSYAIFYVDINLEKGDVLSYRYNVNCGSNTLYVILNGETPLKSYSGDSDGWQDEYAVYIANRNVTVNLGFCYLRDTADSFEGQSELAAIRDVYITNVDNVTRATDMLYEAVTQTGVDNAGNLIYTYPSIVMGDDGYYRVGTKDGELLLADITNTTLWSTLHVGTTTFLPEEDASNPYATSMYMLSFWNSKIKYTENDKLHLVYDGEDYADVVVDNFYIQQYSDCGYVPVDSELQEAMQAFTKEYCKQNNLTYTDNQWLEMCYYYVHYGPEENHNHLKDMCFAYDSTVEGLVFRNAYPIEEGEVVEVDNYRAFSILGGGVMYKFTATQKGVYEIRSLGDNTNAYPSVFVYDSDHNIILEQDDDRAYDNFLKNYHDHFCVYATLNAGDTIYVQCTSNFRGETQKYNLQITNLGEKHTALLYCTTGDGVYTYNSFGMIYVAVEVAYDYSAGYYRVIGAEGKSNTRDKFSDDGDNEMWSPVYIDFVRPNFLDIKDHSISWMIDHNEFDFGTSGNFTAVMRQYYAQSIAGKDPSDETYGLLEASQELVDILNRLILKYHDEGPNANGWLSMACYYAYFGYENYADTQN